MSGGKPVRVLVVTSDAAPPESVEPVCRAMERAGIELSLVDCGRAGTRVAGRRILRGLLTTPPEVAFAFDPASASALCEARDDKKSFAPVVGLMPELEPRKAWGETDCDRYLTMDDSAAVELTELGVEGKRVIATGPIGSRRFAETVKESRTSLRKQFKLETSRVILAEVWGFGYDTTQQIALQLALLGRGFTTLFDSGSDQEAATALRCHVPTLDMRAKLFGRSDDAPKLWRAANVVVARPTLRAVSHALLLGARFVAIDPQGDDQEKLAKAVQERGIGATARTPLLLSSAIEEVLEGTGNIKAYAGRNGARIAADIARVIAHDREGVLKETREVAEQRTRAAEQARRADAFEADAQRAYETRTTAAAGGLEDLSGDHSVDLDGDGVPDSAGEISQLRAELSTRIERMKKRIWEARKAAESWDRKHQTADAEGDKQLAKDAARKADAERARTHEALEELQRLEKEGKTLEDAAMYSAARGSARTGARPRSARAGTRPRQTGRSVDDLLKQMKRKQAASVDDELAALKKRMRKGKGR